MRIRWVWPGFLCAVAVLVLFAGQSCIASPPEWVQVRSSHFTVITDAGEARGDAVAADFEQMRDVFGTFMNRPNLSLSSPLEIVAFRNTKEMRQFVPLWRGKPIDMMGYYHQSRDCGVILLDLSTKNYTQTAFHEYAHELLNANTSVETQPWFEEGFAEYFSTIRADGSDAEVGALHAKDFKVVRHKRLMATSDLLRVRQDSAIYNENGEARNVFYGQSWLMVHYLFDTHTLPQAFAYFSLLSEGTITVENAFRQAFGMTTEQFDGVLKQYARQKSLGSTSVAVSSDGKANSYQVRILSGTEADAQLADVHLHSPDYDEQAVREFDSVLKRNANEAIALRGLGYAYLQDRNFAKAAEFLGRAERVSPADARVHYYAALLIKEEAGSGGSRPTADSIVVMQQELRKVLSLESDYAAAYQLLALTYEWQGNGDKSIEAIKRAVALNPKNETYRADLGRVSHGAESVATTVLNPLEQPRPLVSTQASQGKPVTQTGQREGNSRNK
jgi:tetratricopeptide (TPR) repeat protein